MVREQAALVAQQGVLVPVKQEGGHVARKGGVVVGLRGDRVVDGRVEVPVLADHAVHEAVVVLEERVGIRRPARFVD